MKRVFTFLFLALAINVVAEGRDTLVPGERFASYLQEQGEYYRAITEYLRLLQEYPENPRNLDWRTNILACYQQAGETDDALQWASRWISLGESFASGKSQSVLYPVKLALDGGRYDFVFAMRARGVQLQDSLDSCQLQRGYAIALAARGVAREIDSLVAVQKNWMPRFSADLKAAAHVRQKSPGLGRLFSVFPGGGYIYAGKPATATASLVIISLLSFGMYESIRNDQAALAIGMGIFNFAWYTGSIYVSAKLVDQWNQREKRSVIVRLKQYF